jgi:hypothetical protein
MLRMDSWAMLSKKPFMSASRTQVSLPVLLMQDISETLFYSIMAAPSGSKPVGIGFKHGFPFGIRVSSLLLPVRFCHARSGYKRGRFLPLGLGISTLRTGLKLPLHLTLTNMAQAFVL